MTDHVGGIFFVRRDSDIALADDDGLRILALVRERAPDLPAVAVSGYAAPTDADGAIAAGFDIHIAKPVAPMQLVAALRRVLGTRKSRPAAS